MCAFVIVPFRVDLHTNASSAGRLRSLRPTRDNGEWSCARFHAYGAHALADILVGDPLFEPRNLRGHHRAEAIGALRRELDRGAVAVATRGPGDGAVELPIGGNFHRERGYLICGVGGLNPARTGRDLGKVSRLRGR